MDFVKLKSLMLLNGDTQQKLSDAMGIARNTLNSKLNGKEGAVFTLPEIKFICDRYSITGDQIVDIFFNSGVSKTDTNVIQKMMQSY